MQIINGQFLEFTSDPSLGDEEPYTHITKGSLVLDEGLIVWRGNAIDLPAEYKSVPIKSYPDCLIMPGFIDAHLHFPQYRMIAAFGKDLLDWLNRYTFIEEQRYGDKDIASAAAAFFLDELARNGTTSCVAFSTIHPVALDALFNEADTRDMALISGKTMMDRNAPKALMDTATSAYDDSKALIKKWAGKGRLGYAVTPRFAVTSTQAQLEVAGALFKEFPDTWMQTHLSENNAEIASVRKDFPDSKDYTDVYDQVALLGKKALFAHGVHLNERELSCLSESGSAIVHCPTSNNFLGSGLFRYHATRKANVKIAMGSDIGGGTGYSMLETMRDAYIVSQLAGERISAFDAFYGSTLGNARILGLENEIGTLNVGSYADLVVLDPQATPIMKERHTLSQSIHDVLFALMIMGDDRAIKQTYIAGKSQK
ncbi:MAG: guanine deaminase [Rhizobiaceae bacterium]